LFGFCNSVFVYKKTNKIFICSPGLDGIKGSEGAPGPRGFDGLKGGKGDVGPGGFDGEKGADIFLSQKKIISI